jgi:hypothetical protein
MNSCTRLENQKWEKHEGCYVKFLIEQIWCKKSGGSGLEKTQSQYLIANNHSQTFNGDLNALQKTCKTWNKLTVVRFPGELSCFFSGAAVLCLQHSSLPSLKFFPNTNSKSDEHLGSYSNTSLTHVEINLEDLLEGCCKAYTGAWTCKMWSLPGCKAFGQLQSCTLILLTLRRHWLFE